MKKLVMALFVSMCFFGFIILTRPASSQTGVAVPRIELSSTTIPLDGTITFTVYGQLIDKDTGTPHILDPYLIKVRIESIYVWDSARQMYTLRPGFTPVEVPKGSSWAITFGTNAPDKNKWGPPSSTSEASPPSYMVDFNGVFYTSEGGGKITPFGNEFWFDIPKKFQVPELSIAVAVAAAAPLMLILKRRLVKK